MQQFDSAILFIRANRALRSKSFTSGHVEMLAPV